MKVSPLSLGRNERLRFEPLTSSITYGCPATIDHGPGAKKVNVTDCPVALPAEPASRFAPLKISSVRFDASIPLGTVIVNVGKFAKLNVFENVA